MGEAIVKGANHFFKKAHDGFETWVKKHQRNIGIAIGLGLCSMAMYEVSAPLINQILDINMPTPLTDLGRSLGYSPR